VLDELVLSSGEAVFKGVWVTLVRKLVRDP
jgi:hypothetical protein